MKGWIGRSQRIFRVQSYDTFNKYLKQFAKNQTISKYCNYPRKRSRVFLGTQNIQHLNKIKFTVFGTQLKTLAHKETRNCDPKWGINSANPDISRINTDVRVSREKKSPIVITTVLHTSRSWKSDGTC